MCSTAVKNIVMYAVLTASAACMQIFIYIHPLTIKGLKILLKSPSLSLTLKTFLRKCKFVQGLQCNFTRF